MNSPAAVPELDRRLYPHSWVFALIKALPQMLPLLIAGGFLGKADSLMVRGIIVSAIFVMIIVFQIIASRITRWSIANQAVFVRTGIFDKDTKIIPFNRIQNVKLTQNVLHRVFGVARVELESAGSKKPEATFDVLRYNDARALSDLIQSRGKVSADGMPVVEEIKGDVLLHMPIGELIRFGFVSNRGMIVLAAAFAATMQFMDDFWDTFTGFLIKHFDFSNQVDRIVHLSTPMLIAFAVSLIALVIVFVRLLSIVLAFWTHYNFTLTEQPRRLQTERGLFARWHDAIVKSRIQSFRIKEGIWHRLVNRQTVDVDTLSGSDGAMNEDGTAKKQSNHLLPVATPQRAAQIIEHLAQGLEIDGRAWQRIETKNFARLFVGQLLTLIPAVVGTQVMLRFIPQMQSWVNQPIYFSAIGIWLLSCIISAAYQVRFHAYSLDSNSFAVRRGWLSRKWHFSEIRRAHVVSLQQGPVDRWFNTATLTMDTPGAARGVLKMPLLPYPRAVELRDAITGELNRSIQS